MDMSVPVIGFLSYMAVFLALPFAAFAGWRLGATSQEEADGRLDNLLVRGVERRRWLAVTTVYAFLAASILVVASGAGLLAGAQLVDARVTVAQVAEPLAGTLPLVALCTGIAVLAFGIAPRLTTVAPVTLAVVGYLLDTFGSMLEWPRAVLAVSPFHHLARLPGTPMTMTAAVVMTAAGVAAAASASRLLHGATFAAPSSDAVARQGRLQPACLAREARMCHADGHIMTTAGGGGHGGSARRPVGLRRRTGQEQRLAGTVRADAELPRPRQGRDRA